MLFQSQEFILLFLPAAVICYYLVAGSAVARQSVLIAASLVFYGWWDARFIPLLVGQIGATWLLARLQRATGRNGFLVLGVVLNLASLATFKYLDFLIGSGEALVGITLPRAHLILPIGISFFSFQLISYLADRMRGDAPVYPFRPFALFVLLFPHLIAGPIVRHNELVPQFAEDPRRDGLWARMSLGLVLFTIGLTKKVLIADRLAEIADPLFTDAAKRMLTFGEAWSATLAFTFQLFCDFSGYTEMAIGIALLFGLLLPENFRRPYLSTNLPAAPELARTAGSRAYRNRGADFRAGALGPRNQEHASNAMAGDCGRGGGARRILRARGRQRTAPQFYLFPVLMRANRWNRAPSQSRTQARRSSRTGRRRRPGGCGAASPPCSLAPSLAGLDRSTRPCC
jgi:MBOAT, membrane-bound O-acyltransferase family